MGEPGGVLFDAGKCDVSPLLCIELHMLILIDTCLLSDYHFSLYSLILSL